MSWALPLSESETERGGYLYTSYRTLKAQRSKWYSPQRATRIPTPFRIDCVVTHQPCFRDKRRNADQEPAVVGDVRKSFPCPTGLIY